jgi:protein TonB
LVTQSLAWGAAIAVHLILLVLASRTEPSLENWAAAMAAVIHADLAEQAPIAIDAAQRPPAPEEVQPEPESAPVPDSTPEVVTEVAEFVDEAARPEPVPSIVRPSRDTSSAEIEAPADPPANPAEPAQAAQAGQAGQVLTADPETAGPVDLTDNSFVAGTASAYVGGATTSAGTGIAPVSMSAVNRDGEAVAGTSAAAAQPPAEARRRRSRARPVQLQGGEWNCDWPAAALAQDIYEQAVVVRVVVDSAGDVVDASAAADPGYGFADAAIACARQRRFTPARNDDGENVRATSPPIRVRFTR